MTEEKYKLLLKSEYQKLIKIQYPNIEQKSRMYKFIIDLVESIDNDVFLKEGTLEYYSITDGDILVNKIDERELFLNDMKSSKSVFEFLSFSSRNSYISEKDKELRRISIYKNGLN